MKTIPHEEKMFSIFETHTEWVKKGKSRPNVELGKKGETIQIRQCSEPTDHVRHICNKLKYAVIPFPRKKSLWHPGEYFKNPKINYQLVTDG